MKDRFAVSMFGQKRLSREGGIEIVVKELCTRMARDGCQVTCYNRSGHHVSGAEYDNKIEYDGIRQKFVPTIERKGLAAVSSSFFAALYSAFGKYDVVHIHAEGPAFFSWLPKMFRKRVVVTIHGIDWQREKWKSGFGSKFIRQGEKNAVKYADEIIVLSKGVQDYFKDTYGRETHFIPNGVNRPETREAGLITEKFGLTKDSYILFLGRLVPEKGIRYLVEAFKNVKTDKKLVIAGGSSDTDSFMVELKELAKDDDRIIFTGFVQGQMLDELYSNAYIYTLPSDLEGMPLSLLEAMSYGNCCLVSDISECTEVVDNKALIFKKSDVDELREKLQDACDHPEKVMEMKAQATDFICCLDKLTYAGNLSTLAPVMDNPNFRFVKADICDREAVDKLFEEEHPDIVVNFAAESHVDRSIEDPGIFLQTNIIGTSVLMDACRKYGIQRYHQVSTDEVYGDLPLDRPDLFFTEETPIHTSSPYSSSKAAADLLVLAYHRTYGLPVTISRCSNNYGPYHFPEKLIPLMIANALVDKPLPVYGEGLNVRDWLYVEDHCKAIDLIIHKGRVGEVYNVGGHNEKQNIEIVKIICKELGKPESLITHVGDRKGHDMRYAIDPTKIHNELGWLPETKFEDGIKKTIQWYLDNREWWETIISGEYQNYYEKMYSNR